MEGAAATQHQVHRHHQGACCLCLMFMSLNLVHVLLDSRLTPKKLAHPVVKIISHTCIASLRVDVRIAQDICYIAESGMGNSVPGASGRAHSGNVHHTRKLSELVSNSVRAHAHTHTELLHEKMSPKRVNE